MHHDIGHSKVCLCNIRALSDKLVLSGKYVESQLLLIAKRFVITSLDEIKGSIVRHKNPPSS